MTTLLDVNVVIALLDPRHIGHIAAHTWFSSPTRGRWATCPIVENGVIRIVGSPKYVTSPGPPSNVMRLLGKLRSYGGHEFWPNEFSLLDSDLVQVSAALRPEDITDGYLLALAVSRRGKLATFDTKIRSAFVTGGRDALIAIQ